MIGPAVVLVTGVALNGWMQPQFGVLNRPQALPRDQWAYGIGQSRAGIMIHGEPIDTFSYMIHITLGGDALDRALGVEELTATWQPVEDFTLQMGRMRIPYSAQAFSIQTTLMFPTRSGPNEVFLPGTDLGVLATGRLPSAGLSASLGIWNGNGQEAGASSVVPEDRGFLYSGRVDWTYGGDFPFVEGDLHRGDFRLGLGAAANFRQSVGFDTNGFPTTDKQDLRLSATLRMAVKGFYMQAEGMRRETTDNLSPLTRGATGAYVQSSYYFLVDGVGLSPAARVGWSREDENFGGPTGEGFETNYLEGGFAVYPNGEDEQPDALRFMLVYQGEWHTTEGEEAHRLAFWVQLLF